MWTLERGRHEVIGEVRGEVVARFIVSNFLHEGDGEAFGQTTVNLALDNHWVDDRAAIVHREEASDFGFAGVRIDINDRDIRAVREDHVGWVVVQGGLEAGFVRTRIRVGGEGDFFHRHAFAGHAHDFKFVIFPLEVAFIHLEKMGCEFLGLLADFACGERECSTGHGCRAAGIRAEAVWRGVRIALFNQEVLRI